MNEIMGNKILFQIAIIYLCSLKAIAENLPPIEFQALSPRGIRVSMPDNGFSSFTLVGNLRRNAETKQWQTYVPRAKNGYWVFTDRNYELKIGDVIFYTVYVVKNKIRYQTDGNWSVREFVSDDEALNCELSATTTLCSKKICKNTLIFSEDFNDANNFMWQKEDMFPQEPDYPFNAYSSDQIRVINGQVTIEAKRTLSGSTPQWDFGYKCTGETSTRECKQVMSGTQILPPVVSGKITTRKIFSFRYGKVEVRAKLPVGNWLIPEINLEPLFHEYGRQEYGSGLMRVACVKGNQEFSHELYGGPIVADAEPFRSIFLTTVNKTSGNWNDDFHVYTFIWKPTGFELLVDGELYGEIDPNDGTNTEDSRNVPHAETWARGTSIAPLDEMFYISLGLRVGGINDFPDSPEKPWRNNSNKAMFKFWENTYFWHKTWISPQLIVDYVRVYSL